MRRVERKRKKERVFAPAWFLEGSEFSQCGIVSSVHQKSHQQAERIGEGMKRRLDSEETRYHEPGGRRSFGGNDEGRRRRNGMSFMTVVGTLLLSTLMMNASDVFGRKSMNAVDARLVASERMFQG
jgi:hypothetical protein